MIVFLFFGVLLFLIGLVLLFKEPHVSNRGHFVIKRECKGLWIAYLRKYPVFFVHGKTRGETLEKFNKLLKAMIEMIIVKREALDNEDSNKE